MAASCPFFFAPLSAQRIAEMNVDTLRRVEKVMAATEGTRATRGFNNMENMTAKERKEASEVRTELVW